MLWQQWRFKVAVAWKYGWLPSFFYFTKIICLAFRIKLQGIITFFHLEKFWRNKIFKITNMIQHTKRKIFELICFKPEIFAMLKLHCCQEGIFKNSFVVSLFKWNTPWFSTNNYWPAIHPNQEIALFIKSVGSQLKWRKRVTGLKPIFHKGNLFARNEKTNIGYLIGQRKNSPQEIWIRPKFAQCRMGLMSQWLKVTTNVFVRRLLAFFLFNMLLIKSWSQSYCYVFKSI
jgi:hypothetical protein